jgi:hypothetical protein
MKPKRILEILGQVLLVALLLTVVEWYMCISCAWEGAKRAKQKNVQSDMKYLSQAVEQYHIKKGKYPSTNVTKSTMWYFVPLKQIEPQLNVTCFRNLPLQDYWGTPYYYAYSDLNDTYCLVSCASNKKMDSNVIPDSLVETHCYESDIIIVNGQYFKRPEGKQSNCKSRIQ